MARFSSIGLFIVLPMAITITMTLAQDRPQDFLAAHNAARDQVGVGPIFWDETVAAYARNYANQRAGDCLLVASGGPYGENLVWSNVDLSGSAAVSLWVDEKNDYDYVSNKCAVGKDCLSYTQVVWRNSVRLGCAKVRCATGGTFIICSYSPPGNTSENVLTDRS